MWRSITRGRRRCRGGWESAWVRPGVLVMNLANSGAPVAAAGDIAYTDFPVKIRNPIRSYLIVNNLTQRVRCLVMTRGLPHRMQDSDVPAIGDDPASLVDEFNASDVTCASVDSELTLLWIDLNAGENGGAADSKDDGCILNPYWRASLPIGSFTNVNNRAAKTFTASGPGPVWMLGGTGASKLTAGDMLLVTRLDGRSLADVRGMIDRAQNLIYNVNTANVILDESGSDGVADAAANSELDNQGSLPALRSGDDYERARDYMLNTDKRFAPGVIHYDVLQDAAHFFVGPRIDFQGQGMLVTGPVALLATYGSNHAGTFPTTAGGQRPRRRPLPSRTTMRTGRSSTRLRASMGGTMAGSAGSRSFRRSSRATSSRRAGRLRSGMCGSPWRTRCRTMSSWSRTTCWGT